MLTVVAVTIFLGCVTAVRAVNKGLMVLFMFQSAMLVLVYGQAIWLENKFQGGHLNLVEVGLNVVRYDDAYFLSCFFYASRVFLV